jgi:hypothetical protein
MTRSAPLPAGTATCALPAEIQARRGTLGAIHH